MPWEDPSQGSGWAQSGAPAPQRGVCHTQCGVCHTQCGATQGGCGCLAPWAWGLPGFTVGVRLLVWGVPCPGGGSGSRLWDGRGVGAAWGSPRPPVGPAAAGAVRGADGGVRRGRALPARAPCAPPTHPRVLAWHLRVPLIDSPGSINTCPEAQSSLTRPPPKERRSLGGRGEQSPPPSPGQPSLSERLD